VASWTSGATGAQEGNTAKLTVSKAREISGGTLLVSGAVRGSRWTTPSKDEDRIL